MTSPSSENYVLTQQHPHMTCERNSQEKNGLAIQLLRLAA